MSQGKKLIWQSSSPEDNRRFLQPLAVIVVVIDPFADPRSQLCRTEVVIQQDEVFHRTVIALYLPLGHGMIGPCADVPDLLFFQVTFQLPGDIARAVVYRERIKRSHNRIADPIK